MEELAKMVNEMVEEEKAKLIRLGVDIAAVRNAYWYKDLLAFLKGDDENNGSMYFANLKPLYDKYGYKLVNDTLLNFDKEESKTNE